MQWKSQLLERAAQVFGGAPDSAPAVDLKTLHTKDRAADAEERFFRTRAIDICYIPMARGFVYLAAVMDWYSGKILAWRYPTA